MMLHKYFVIACTVVLLGSPRTINGQEADHDNVVSVELFPGGLHFTPLKGNHQEARIGVFAYFGSEHLKVDIGNTVDLFGISWASSGIRLTAGIEFMAYAYTTGAQGFRLQLDALDGFFGGNIAFSQQNEKGRFLSRLRILHLSAHLVDGHYDVITKSWIDNKEPFAFSKDFGELLVGHERRSGSIRLRYYGGVSYATLVRPADIERFTFFGGLELTTPSFGRILDQPVHGFLADHFSLAGNPKYIGNNYLQAGVKLGMQEGKGVALYVAYYFGMNFFSEYYDQKVKIVGAGFAVDFP